MAVDNERLQRIFTELLEAIGEDPTRAGIQDTPRRMANFWTEFIDYDPGKIDTVFESITADQLVVVSGMRVWSLCEHHLMPFWCDISVGYLTDESVLGLSKFARIAHKHAHKLQIQERLVQDIADEVSLLGKTEHVAVMARGIHLCMTMRGIKTPGTMTSSVTMGNFRLDSTLRQEFLSIVDANPPATFPV